MKIGETQTRNKIDYVRLRNSLRACVRPCVRMFVGAPSLAQKDKTIEQSMVQEDRKSSLSHRLLIPVAGSRVAG